MWIHLNRRPRSTSSRATDRQTDRQTPRSTCHRQHVTPARDLDGWPQTQAAVAYDPASWRRDNSDRLAFSQVVDQLATFVYVLRRHVKAGTHCSLRPFLRDRENLLYFPHAFQSSTQHSQTSNSRHSTHGFQFKYWKLSIPRRIHSLSLAGLYNWHSTTNSVPRLTHSVVKAQTAIESFKWKSRDYAVTH